MEKNSRSQQQKTRKPKPGYLYAFDFDHTIVDTNSDTAVTDLLSSPLPQEIKKIYDGTNWTVYMDNVLKYMASQGITPAQIFTRIQSLPFLPGMVPLLQRICTAVHDSKSRLLIVSDANDFFIEAALQSLQPTVQPSEIITNTCELPSSDDPPSADNYIQVKPYENQQACPICPVNLCKGTALLKYMEDEGPFESVFYFGDGANDLCPAMKLTPKDTVFVRKGYALDNLIKSCYSKFGKVKVDIKAQTHYFEDAKKLDQYLKF